jgi:hypothetical protein
MEPPKPLNLDREKSNLATNDNSPLEIETAAAVKSRNRLNAAMLR